MVTGAGCPTERSGAAATTPEGAAAAVVAKLLPPRETPSIYGFMLEKHAQLNKTSKIADQSSRDTAVQKVHCFHRQINRSVG